MLLRQTSTASPAQSATGVSPLLSTFVLVLLSSYIASDTVWPISDTRDHFPFVFRALCSVGQNNASCKAMTELCVQEAHLCTAGEQAVGQGEAVLIPNEGLWHALGRGSV